MNKKEIMNSEFGSMVMYAIENRISQLDSEFQKKGITLNDSNIKSGLAKAEKLVKTGSLSSPPRDKKEEAVFQIAKELNKIRLDFNDMDHDKPSEKVDVGISFWIDVLDAIKGSLNLRMVPGGRYYLDYLEVFIAEAQTKIKL